MVSEVGTLLAPKVRLFVRLITRVCPVGTVITTGDQPSAVGCNAAHAAVEPLTAAPQVEPHIGTTGPSGKVMLVGPAVRLTCCWATAQLAPRRRTNTATAVVLKVALR